MDTPDTPLVCDMTDAPDTGAERMADYARLFEHALVGRARTATGLEWRFRARPGVPALVRDLAARETACCAFLTMSVDVTGGEVTWRIGSDGTPGADLLLDEFSRLPEDLAGGFDGLLRRLAEAGVAVHTRDGR